MRTSTLALASACLVLVACPGAPRGGGPRGVGTLHPEPPRRATISAGTYLTVQLDRALGTTFSQPGERFSAWVVDGVRGRYGEALVADRAEVTGHVIGVQPGVDRMLVVAFDRIETVRGPVPLAAEIMSLAGERHLGSQLGRGLDGRPRLFEHGEPPPVDVTFPPGTRIVLQLTDRIVLPAKR